MTDLQKEFINNIHPIIHREAVLRGYKSPLAITAQACVESNYGKSSLAKNYHNYFGLKCGSKWTGKRVVLKTGEVIDGKNVTMKDAFRVYESMDSGVVGYFNFINTSRYANLKGLDDVESYAWQIQADGYATSPTYAETVIKCAKSIEAVTSCIASDFVPQYSTASDDAIDTVARMVISGAFGNGHEIRKARIYGEIQGRVNAALQNGAKLTHDALDIIAADVIKGVYGNGSERVDNIYKPIAERVNFLLSKK